MQNPIYSIVVINQFNSEHYILIQNEIYVKREALFFKRELFGMTSKVRGNSLSVIRLREEGGRASSEGDCLR